MDRVEIIKWMILDSIPGLQKRTLFKLLSRYSLAQLIELPTEELCSYHFNAEQIKTLKYPNLNVIEKRVSFLDEGSSNSIICFSDPRYPSLLKEIASPPLILYLQGDTSLLNSNQIAIVGSRKCTPYGQRQAYRFAQELDLNGFTITSGLALGIDGYAHQGTLDNEGKTIAVLGTGLNNIYPKRHLKLSQEIKEKGLLVSEFWPDAVALPSHFPQRNRIIAGLSLGVLVIEASVRSGSLITARYGLEQNKEIFALPGSVENNEACGCARLIQQGAKLVLTSEDIFNEFTNISSNKFVCNQYQTEPSDTELYPLLKYIDFFEISLEKLLSSTNLDLINLQNQLVELEIAGIISSTPNGYIRLKR